MPKNRLVRPFVSTFHTPNYSIWAKRNENFSQNVLPAYFSTFQNLRLGTIKSQGAYRTARRTRFSWSMCDIGFCISWPKKTQGAIVASIVASKKSRAFGPRVKKYENVDKKNR